MTFYSRLGALQRRTSIFKWTFGDSRCLRHVHFFIHNLFIVDSIMTMSNKLFPIEHIRPSLKRKGGRTAAVAKYDSSDNNVEGALAVFSSSSLVSAPSMEAHVAKEPSGYKNNASAKIVSSNRRYSLHEIIPPSIASARIFLPSNLCNRVFKCSIKGFCNYLMGLRPTEAATGSD